MQRHQTLFFSFSPQTWPTLYFCLWSLCWCFLWLVWLCSETLYPCILEISQAVSFSYSIFIRLLIIILPCFDEESLENFHSLTLGNIVVSCEPHQLQVLYVKTVIFSRTNYRAFSPSRLLPDKPSFGLTKLLQNYIFDEQCLRFRILRAFDSKILDYCQPCFISLFV